MRFKSTLLGFLLVLLPIGAFSQTIGQVDAIKNLTSSARTYTLSNPTANITIQPGQTIDIQDTQYQSSSALQNDVSSGYLNEYVVGSPNATNTFYTQPVTIGNTNTAQAGLTISEESGITPGLSVTQTNSGDIADLYQSQTLEYALNNAFFGVTPPAIFQQYIEVGASASTGGTLYFGSSQGVLEEYATSSGTFPANTFGFSGGPISTSAYQGYYIGTFGVLSEDNTQHSIILAAPTSGGMITFKGNTTTFASLTSSGLAVGSSSFGTNTAVAGTLSVTGVASFGALAASSVTSLNFVGNNDLDLRAGMGGNSIKLYNAADSTINQQFNDDGSFTLADGNIVGSSSGGLTASTLATTNFILTGAGAFTVSSNTAIWQDVNGGGGVKFQSIGGSNLLVLNDNTSGSLANGNVTWTSGGTVIVTALVSGNISGSVITGSGAVQGATLTAAGSSSTGTVYFGTNLSHLLSFDGTQYNLPGANLILSGGGITATAATLSGAATLLPTGTSTSVTTYPSNALTLESSSWGGSSAQTNTGTEQFTASQLFAFSNGLSVTGGATFSSSITTSGLTVPSITTTSGGLTVSTASNASAITLQGLQVNISSSLVLGSTTLTATSESLNGNFAAVNATLSGNVGAVNGVFSGSVTAASITDNGAALITGLLHVGGSSIFFGSNGDVVAEEGNASGRVYLGNTGTYYLGYTNAGGYALPGANLTVGGQITATQFNGSGAGLTAGTIANSSFAVMPVDTVNVSSPLVETGSAPTITITCPTCLTNILVGTGLSTTGGTTPTLSIASTYAMQVVNSGGTDYSTPQWTVDTFSASFSCTGADTCSAGSFNMSGVTSLSHCTASQSHSGVGIGDVIPSSGSVSVEILNPQNNTVSGSTKITISCLD